MGTINLKGGKSKTASKPAGRSTRKTTTRTAPAKSKAKTTPARGRAKVTQTKPAATESNGRGGRTPQIPEGMTQAQMDRKLARLEKLTETKVAAEEKFKAALEALHEEALELLAEDIPMALVATSMDTSRQWLYTLMEKNGVLTSRMQAGRKPTRKPRPGEKATTRRKAPTGKTSAGTRTTRSKATTTRGRSAKKPAARSTSRTSRGGIKLSGRR